MMTYVTHNGRYRLVSRQLSLTICNLSRASVRNAQTRLVMSVLQALPGLGGFYGRAISG